MDKYFDGDYLQFQVKNADGSFDKSINLNETLVGDVEDLVNFLKRTSDSNLSDKMFEVLIEFCLIHSLSMLNEYRDLIVKLSGDSNGI